jgi:hypothetical protein
LRKHKEAIGTGEVAVFKEPLTLLETEARKRQAARRGIEEIAKNCIIVAGAHMLVGRVEKACGLDGGRSLTSSMPKDRSRN